MGEFQEYGKRMNDIAKAAIQQYQAALSKVQKAEDAYKKASDPYKDPTRSDYEHQAYIARTKADLLDAQNGLRTAKTVMLTEVDSIKAVGKELQKAVSDRFTADGSQVDSGTLELLKSGILKAHEYISLYDRAKKAGNNTMMRIIGKYAGEGAANAPTAELERQMRMIAAAAGMATGGEYIDLYGAFLDVYSRTANNPAMIKRWDEITEPILQRF